MKSITETILITTEELNAKVDAITGYEDAEKKKAIHETLTLREAWKQEGAQFIGEYIFHPNGRMYIVVGKERKE